MRTPTQRFLFRLALPALILAMTIGISKADTFGIDSTKQATAATLDSGQTTVNATLAGTQITAQGKLFVLTNATIASTKTGTGTNIVLTATTTDSALLNNIARQTGQQISFTLGGTKRSQITYVLTAKISAISTGGGDLATEIELSPISISNDVNYTNNGAVKGGGDTSPYGKVSATKTTTLTNAKHSTSTSAGTATQ